MFRSTAFFLAASLLTVRPLISAEPQPPLETLRPDDISPGCLCSFSLQPQADSSVPLVFALDLSSGQGLIRVAGSLLRLTRISSEENKKRAHKDSVGDRYIEVWGSGSTSLTLRYKTTFVCPPADSSCSHTDYQGTLALEHDAGNLRLDIWGGCGCPSGG